MHTINDQIFTPNARSRRGSKRLNYVHVFRTNAPGSAPKTTTIKKLATPTIYRELRHGRSRLRIPNARSAIFPPPSAGRSSQKARLKRLDNADISPPGQKQPKCPFFIGK